MIYDTTCTATDFPPLATSWDATSIILNEDCDDEDVMMVVIQDEELSASSNEEASKVFEEWRADDEDDVINNDFKYINGVQEIMDMDTEIDSCNLLDDAIFSEDPCLSPTGPLEELVSMDANEYDKYLVPCLDFERDGSVHSSSDNSQSDIEEQYQETLRKLTESMKRSQETRRSLTLKSPKTKTYERSSEVDGVLSSVEKSTRQLQHYLEKNQRIM